MVRPYIYSVADASYRKVYAPAFINSARAQGHEAEVFCDGVSSMGSLQLRTHYTLWRFQMLPSLLAKHPAVMCIDLDSIILRPIEIEPEYDAGLFLRVKKQENARVLAAVSYFTDRAMAFAEALAEACSAPGLIWGDDQTILWRTYDAFRDKLNFKTFNETEHMGWKPGTPAWIYTGKGVRKYGNDFVSAVRSWSNREEAAA